MTTTPPPSLFSLSALLALVSLACATPSSEIRSHDPHREAYELRSADEVAAKKATARPAEAAVAPTAETPAWRAGTFMKQAVDTVAFAAQKLRAKFTHIGFDDGGACVMGAFLPSGRSIRSARTFVPGVQYVIVGSAHAAAPGVTVRVLGETGEVIGEDTDTLAVVEFQVSGAGKVELEVSSDKAGESGAFVAISILKAGGLNVPADRLSRSFADAVQRSMLASALAKKADVGATGVIFHEAPDWALYSVVLAQGEIWDASGIDLKGPTVVVTGSDGAVSDLDMAISGPDGDPIANHSDGGASPMALLTGKEAPAIRARLTSTASASPSLVTMLVLDVARQKEP